MTGTEVLLGGGLNLAGGNSLIFFIVFFAGWEAKPVELIEAGHRGQSTQILPTNFSLPDHLGLCTTKLPIGQSVLPQLGDFLKKLLFQQLQLARLCPGIKSDEAWSKTRMTLRADVIRQPQFRADTHEKPAAEIAAGLAKLSNTERPLAAACGGFHIFHREDLRAIAPLWLRYTSEVRAFAHAEPETYLAESFLNWRAASAALSDADAATKRKQAMWQAEMYGYAFAAADGTSRLRSLSNDPLRLSGSGGGGVGAAARCAS